jgi:dihydroxyacetone kinase
VVIIIVTLYYRTLSMLIVVKSYTGDVLQFGIAQEHFQALHPDLKKKTRFLVVGDDISVGRKQGRLVGRRGIAGVPLVYKVAGSLARNGADIDEVERVAKIVANGLATLGCSLDRCHIPGGGSSADHENLEIRPSHLELGSGIFGHISFPITIVYISIVQVYTMSLGFRLCLSALIRKP